MRILFVSNLYPNPYHAHRAPWNRQQVAALANRHEVTVISPLAWTDEWAWRRAQGKQLPATRQVQVGGVTVDHPRYYFPPKVGRSLYGDFYRRSIASSFESAVRKFQPDVVLTAWAYPDGWAATRLSQRHGLPCVVKVHGSDILLLDDFPARRRKTVEALESATKVVSVSQDLAAAIARLGVARRKVTVVYDGVDTEHFFPGPHEEARRRIGIDVALPAILFVGNLVPVKGVDRLLHAVAQLLASGDEFHLHIVGDGPLRTALQSQANESGLAEHVTFHGSKPHAELPDWFRAASVFCLPSHSEGVPNVLLESAACGVPFVAFDVGGISEIAHLGPSQLVSQKAPHQLASALRGYINTHQPQTAPTRPFRSFGDSAHDLELVLAEALELPSSNPASEEAPA